MPLDLELAEGKILVTPNISSVGLVVPEKLGVAGVVFGCVYQISALGSPLYALEDYVAYPSDAAIEVGDGTNVYYLLDEEEVLFKEVTPP